MIGFLKNVKSLDCSIKHLPGISNMKNICIQKVLKMNNVIQIWVKTQRLKKHMTWLKILETIPEEVTLVHHISAAKKEGR